MSLAIVDLASMFHRLWHVDRDNVERKIVSFLKTLQQAKIIVAVDSPPYKRKEVFAGYKANRDVPEPELIGCLKNVIAKVTDEGFYIARAEGWEADDVIATIINEMMDKGEYVAGEVTVYGSDKDLLQITDLTDPFNGERKDAITRLLVCQDQVVDYLALVGDTSDNIQGVKGVGEKTAQSLLSAFGSIEGIYDAIDSAPEKFTKPAVLQALKDARETIQQSIDLIKLNCCAPVTYEQKEIARVEMEEVKAADTEPVQETRITLRTEPVEYKRSLEPVDLNQCHKVATMFDKSGLYPRFKGPEQIMMTVMRGRELGLGALTSLELIDMIQGKPTMKAAGMLALVMSRTDVCEYIYCSEMTEEKCTWVTKRRGVPKDVTRTFTIQDAEKMQLTSKDNWKKQPAVMLQWRACSQLIRQVYPDLINCIYATEEME